MSDAYKAMADIRRWACDNLSGEDAGRVCGMLSAVSRHVSEVEAENAEQYARYARAAAEMEVWSTQWEAEYIRNGKLRELVRDMWVCYGRESSGCGFCDHYNSGDCEPMWEACKWESRMHELGVEVPKCSSS